MAEPQPTPDQVPDGWAEGAGGYEESFAVFTGLYADSAVELSGLGSGDRVLDVAAGSGALALRAARQGAEVLATDFAPGMVDTLAARLAAEGHVSSSAVVMDGQALEVEPASFDLAFSMFGLMFFPDIGAGLSGMSAAVRSGGKVCVSSWRNGAFGLVGLVGEALSRAIPGFDPPPRTPPWERIGDPESIARAFFTAGLADVDVHVVTRTFDPPDPEGFFRSLPAWSPPVKPLFAGLDDDVLQGCATAFADVVAEARDTGGLDADALIAIGRKP